MRMLHQGKALATKTYAPNQTKQQRAYGEGGKKKKRKISTCEAKLRAMRMPDNHQGMSASRGMYCQGAYLGHVFMRGGNVLGR